MSKVTKSAPRGRLPLFGGLAVAIVLGFGAVWFAPSLSTPRLPTTADAPSVGMHRPLSAATFEMCGRGARENCVIDGDTFYFHGDKIRVADIDAPETHPSRCAQEEDLGDRATEQLLALLNAGPFTLDDGGDGRDTDVYGRKLRIVMRGGASIGQRLVSQGLAHPWVGHKLPWC